MPSHEQARQILAETRRADGEIALATRDYLALVGAHPENGTGNLALAEIALEQGDWAAARNYASKTTAFRGETDRTQAVQLALAYREALQASDIKTRTAIATDANTLLNRLPRQIALHRLAIDSTIRQQAWLDAMDRLDHALVQFPDSLEFRQVRLLVLQKLGRDQAITRQLEDLVARFPEQITLPDLLVGWHLHQGRPDAAETFLRSAAAAAPDDRSSQLRLVAFLQTRIGVAAALDELGALVMKSGPHDTTYRAMRASMLFRSGSQAQAIAELENLLQSRADTPTEEIAREAIRVDLARMKHRTDDRNGAMSLVDSVLAEDSGHITALKMRGAMQIDANQLDEAVATLRSALREAPRDPQLLTLMAVVHDREHRPDLRRQMLAAAVEASGAGPEESLRLARVLISENRLRLAEETLTTSLEHSPEDIPLLFELVMTYIALSDLPRAIQVGETLARLSRREQGRATIADVTITARSPVQLQHTEANALEAAGDIDAALALYEALYSRFPRNENVATNLAALLSARRNDPASLERAFRISQGLRRSQRP
ncbi:tetratricopeptide repeat protein [Tropicimonas sp. TH_r6]|uniref:tetratricopeptide repeat protein n=1 Tax=Tropicimonas sp. TH_r6 TaxID=3082085 RepID=UPI0029530BC8|nr:tetratricopeptide repeat protein [Tropicimonas sp. TH_r6]MDV7141178.1 tetratricopeptide repeat protein [Tropicimonas sp. TH_r6]